MKNFLLLLILFITQVVNAQTVLKPTTLIIGKGTDVDMSYVVDRAGTSDPFLKWNATTGKWCFSNDAVTCGEMVDKTYVDAQVAGATIADADATTKGKIQLAGDLSGTAAAPTVPALALKAPLASPALTGVPTAPTATALTNNTQIATTAYVDSAVSSSTAPDATTSTKGIVQLAGDLAGTATSPTVPGLALKAPIASPTFTGVPAAPTATAGTNTTQLATTAFVTNAVTTSTAPDATTSTKGIVQLAGDLAGTATSPTVPSLALKAPLASPTLTGDPKAPTATVGDNDTSVATTAFVSTAVTNATDPTKISGPASATDTAIVRYSGTTGKLAQDSVVTVSASGTIATTSGNNLTLSTANTADSVQVVRNIRHQGLVADNLSNDTATGDNQTLSAPTTKVVRLTTANLRSIDGIPAGLVGQELLVVNQTLGNVIFNNETGATAANRIVTGTGANIKVKNNGAIRLVYDTITARWHVTSGVSGTAGLGDPDRAFLQDFEGAVPTDFTTTGTGTIITFGSPLHGDSAIKLTHQTSTGSNTFKQTLALDPKFRGKNVTMQFECQSSASYGNLTLTVRDETNATDLVPSEVILCPDPNSTTFTSSNFYTLTFDVPKTTASLSYKFSGAFEAVDGFGKARADFIDDIQIYTTKLSKMTSALTQSPDSSLVITQQKQMASTNTRILCFEPSFILQNTGDAIKYEADTVLGDRFTALKDGVYNISATISYAGASAGIMLTLNQTDFTSDGNNITANQYISATYSSSSTVNFDSIATASVALKAGDVIRVSQMFGPNAINSGVSVSAKRGKFSMTYQGSLKQTVVNTNSKIKIPTSELRFEGASARGSTDTGVVKYDATTVLRGDAFTINPNGLDTTFGTHVKVNKDGFLCADMSIYNSAGTGEVVLTKNATNRTSSLSLTGNELFSGMSYAGTATGALLNSGNCGFVKNGDIIRPHSLLGPSANAGNIFTLTFQEQDIQVSVSNTLPKFTDTDSMYRAVGSNGYGSTSTKIRRFSSVLDNVGSDISCQDSATLGLACTVNADGVYSISYTDQLSSTAGYIGLSKNTSSQTTAIYSLPASEVLSTAYVSTATAQANANWTGKLLQGDTIRPHTDGTSSAGTQPVVFTMTKIGKPNVSTDVSAFVTLPQANITPWTNYGPMTITATTTAPTKGTTSIDYVKCRQLGEDYECEYNYQQTALGSSGTGEYIFSLPNGIAMDSSKVSFTTATIANGDTYSLQASSLPTIGIVNTNTSRGDLRAYAYSATQFKLTASIAYSALQAMASNHYALNNATEAFKFTIKFPGQGLTSSTANTIAATETFGTDKDALTWSGTYTLSNLNTAPKGTLITFSMSASTNTRTQCTSTNSPTQLPSDMQLNGVQMFARAWGSSGTCAQPTVVAIQIGTGYKGQDFKAFFGAGKTTPMVVTDTNAISSSTEFGMWKQYDPATGILLLDSGNRLNSTTTLHYVGMDPNNNVGRASAYIVISASRVPSLGGIGVATNAITTPNLLKVKECYASYGGAAATLAVPTECSTGTCTEVEDSCNAFSAPTFATTGNYSNLIIANGTFANNTPISCTCKGFTTTSGIVRNCDVAFKTSGNTWITNSSGGYTGDVWAFSATGTASNGYFRVSCKAQAP